MSGGLILPDSLKSGPLVALPAFQKRWVTDGARMKIGMFARQCGKTFTTTLEAVTRIHIAEMQGKRERWVIMSRGERQAEEAMKEGVQRHAEVFGLALSELEKDYRGDDGLEYKSLEVKFPGGSRITALPANPDTARGFSANVIADEFAIHAKDREIWGALAPSISAGHLIRVISTPKGKAKKFYELFTGTDPLWSRHKADIYQAVADGLPRNIPELKALLADDELWAQEYELLFLDGASAWIDIDTILAAEHDHAGRPDKYTGGPCFIGIDIGIRRDLFVIVVLELVGDVYWVREIVAEARISFEAQDAHLARIMKTYRVAKCYMDQTGMGEKPVADAKRRHGSAIVEGIIFNQQSKQTLATAGKQKYQSGRIRTPIDTKLRDDVHAIKRNVAVAGMPSFIVDGETDGHADRAWAIFLACAAAGGGVLLTGGFEAVETRTSQRGANINKTSDEQDDEEDSRGGSRKGVYA